MRYFRTIKYIIVTLLLSLSLSVQAQNKAYSAQEALNLFKAGDYVAAEQAYAYLLKRYDGEPKYNYYYGICLLQNNHELSQAIKRLKYAALKGVSRDAFYYLGRAYQLSYQFDEAIKQYERFLKYATASDIQNDNAEKYKEECKFGLQQSAKVFSLSVYQRDTVLNASILKAYHPAKDVGKIQHNKAFFESGLNPDGILYLTERSDEVYFSMAKDGEGEGLFKMEKLLDGWSDSKALEGINSVANDKQPFVLIDGSTIIFSSDRKGGLGGYDLYKADYDAERKMFAEPINMGIPFNSPKDDYLFVADEFNNLAWFASNRETNDSTLIVYTIKWDNSIVKNFVQDVNQVRTEAALLLSGESFAGKDNGEKNTNGAKTNEQAQFHFVVADTLEYRRLEHFKSEEAKALFVKGQDLQHQKDSLSQLMKQKRQAYARTNSDTERAMLVNDILALEKKVYGLDSSIERSFYEARSVEVNKVKAMVAAGTYSSSTQVKVEKKGLLELEKILIPEEFTFYTDDEFAHQLEELEKMYNLLFSADEIEQLHRADSLYVWGNILNLESSKLLEQANNTPEDSQNVLNILRQRDSLEEESPMQNNIAKATELKELSLRLYHEALDCKNKVYSNRIQEALITNTIEELSFLEEAQADSREYYKEAVELIDPINGYDLLRYEKAGAIKRTGVSIQEENLKTYSQMVRGEKRGQEVKPSVPKTYQELQGLEVERKEPARVVEAAFKKEQEKALVFKIQIGVFRNEPAAEAVSEIPPITKVEIPDKGLTKYFAGQYDSYAEAQKDINRVQAAGFTGAFIVVFKDGKQVNLTEELKQ